MNELGLVGFDDLVEIGRGGFGVVYKARQVDFGRIVAVKLIIAPVDEQVVSRFNRERLALGSLSGHPNIVTVFSSGVTAQGNPYIVMEYLAGGSLSDRIERHPFEWPDAIEVGSKIGYALDMAHDAGVLHRDVKPENILLSPYGEPKLADFGIARLEGVTGTASGVITASIAHAAPEVLEGDPPSVASDVYSLASTIHTLMTAMPPFVRATDQTILPIVNRILREPPPDLRLEGVPDAICDVLEVTMAKDPRDRPVSAAAFAEMLTAAAPADGGRITGGLLDGAPDAPTTHAPAPATGPVGVPAPDGAIAAPNPFPPTTFESPGPPAPLDPAFDPTVAPIVPPSPNPVFPARTHGSTPAGPTPGAPATALGADQLAGASADPGIPVVPIIPVAGVGQAPAGGGPILPPSPPPGAGLGQSPPSPSPSAYPPSFATPYPGAGVTPGQHPGPQPGPQLGPVASGAGPLPNQQLGQPAMQPPGQPLRQGPGPAYPPPHHPQHLAAGGGPKPRRRNPLAILVPVVVVFVVIIGGLGAYIATRPDSTTQAPTNEVFLEAASAPGPNPFTTAITVNTPTAPGSTSTKVVPTTATTIPGGASPTIAASSGAQPGLYGGTQNLASCDPQQLIDFLETNPSKASAWVGALNSDPSLAWSGGTLETSEIRAYVKTLTPVVLDRDTRVTNYGFENGRATPRQAVLQTGTAVLVDSFGVPRTKSACGNPLTKAIPASTSYVGTPWPGWNPVNVIIVQQSPVLITTYVLTNQAGPGQIERPVGTYGTDDIFDLDGGLTTGTNPAVTPSSSPSTVTPTSGGVTTPASNPSPTVVELTGDFCGDLKRFVDEPDATFDDVASQRRVMEGLGELAAEAPAPIKADMEYFRDWFQRLIDDPNAAVDLENQELQTRSNNVTVWVKTNCGFDLNE